GTGSDQDRFLPPANLHGVVGDQAMTADDQIERALALADTALADDQYAEAQDVHQHRVDDRALGQRVLEQRPELRDGRRRHDRRFQQRQPRALRFGDELGRRRETAGDDDAREVEREREPQRVGACGGVEAFEIPDLAFAEDQDASRLQILVEAGQRQAGLLDVGARDATVEAVGAGQQFERQTRRLRPAAEQSADGHAVMGHATIIVERSVDYDSVPTSVSSPFLRRYRTVTADVST